MGQLYSAALAGRGAGESILPKLQAPADEGGGMEEQVRGAQGDHQRARTQDNAPRDEPPRQEEAL